MPFSLYNQEEDISLTLTKCCERFLEKNKHSYALTDVLHITGLTNVLQNMFSVYATSSTIINRMHAVLGGGQRQQSVCKHFLQSAHSIIETHPLCALVAWGLKANTMNRNITSFSLFSLCVISHLLSFVYFQPSDKNIRCQMKQQKLGAVLFLLC